jgi:L-alanine-DL-glutamate epimerase-like enolase superfamily enzyme
VKIADVEVAVIREHNDPVDNREQCALVVVTAEDGTTGYGEANANPDAVKALLESTRGLRGDWDDAPRGIVIGADAGNPADIWSRLKSWSFWSCRAGLGHVALAGVDMALWDLAGKLAGVPTWTLLGEERNPNPLAYVTLYHGPGDVETTWKATREALDQAVDLGFVAAKVEALSKNAPEQRDILTLVSRAREHVGSDFTLLLDVGYRWPDADTALPVARELDAYGYVALEAPFRPEQVADYQALADGISTPIAAGDMLTAAVEYLPMLDSGAVTIVQGGAARTGLSEMVQLAGLAQERGRQFVPWGWAATAFTTAANVAHAVVHDNVPLVEFAPPELYPDARLPSELAGPQPTLRDGRFCTPTRPGLGVELDAEAFKRYRVA